MINAQHLPLISIAMPVYNCEATIGEAIASIINQDFTDWELLIIDDGSTDRTAEQARLFTDSRIRVLDGGDNQHLPKRLNQAVRLARGSYFARMDGDDISYPGRLREQLEYLEQNPQVDLLGGSILIFGSTGDPIGLRQARPSHNKICGTPWRPACLAHVTWMGRREWFQRNLYREDLTHAQDRELLTRTRRKARFASLPGVLVGVREEALCLKKQIFSRKQYFKALCREGVRQRDPALLLVSAPLEIAKLVVDITAIQSGLNYRLLPHRIPNVSQDDAERWMSVLDETRETAAQYENASV
ncbi:MAG: glycosyltransferase family 2 protein [Acidobacteriaceae bacterium]